MIDILATFITFFAVIDPIGTIPVFLAVTDKFEQKAKNRIALLAALYSASILIFFIVMGERLSSLSRYRPLRAQGQCWPQYC